MDTYANLENFEEAKTTIHSILDEMDSFIKQAKNASESVLNSVGGTQTRIGGLIQNKITAVNEEIFVKAKNSLTNMVDNVTTISNTYAQEEDEIANAISNFSA